MNMTRRKFLDLAIKAAFAGSAANILSLGEAIGMYKGGDLEKCDVHVTGCMWCQCGCSMLVYIRDGKAVHVTGNPDDPLTQGRICIKPFGSLELLNSPCRVTKPLKRCRGRGDQAVITEVSWDEALDEIAFKLKELRNRYGGESLGIWASGRSAADARYLSKAFARLYGTRNWEKTGPFCNYSGKLGTATVTGTRNTPWTFTDDDFFAADTYILIGSNLAATKPVFFYRLKKRLQQGKCRLICIDPRVSETARVADTHLAIRPGTDLALALALATFLVRQNMVDERYMEKHAVGYEQYKDFLMKHNFSPGWASQVTGIPQESIKELAHVIAGRGDVIMVANAGISHHANAVHTHRAFSMLAAMTGRYGKKANGYACLNNGAVKTGGLSLPEEMIPTAREELGKNPVMWLESLENPKAPYRLRSLMSTGTPMVQWPEQDRIRRLVGMLDLSVANEIVPNSGINYFDFMLPAAFWIEAGGVAPVSDESRYVWCPRLIDPPGEAKPDRWWWIELGKRMGWDEIFTDNLKDPEVLQDTCGKAKGYSVRNFTQNRHHSLRAPVVMDGKEVKERGTLFLDSKFHTPSGRLEFWTEKLAGMFAETGMEIFPEFYTDPMLASERCTTVSTVSELRPSPFQGRKCLMHPVKLASGQVDVSRYPLFLVTGKPCEAIFGHTCHWTSTLHKFAPEQLCWIHPDTAKRYGIKDRASMAIRSPNGKCTARAWITERIRKDTLFIPSTFDSKIPFMDSGEAATAVCVNFVTGADNRCPISGQIAFKGTRVAVKEIG